jgi:hypothetical protein
VRGRRATPLSAAIQFAMFTKEEKEEIRKIVLKKEPSSTKLVLTK